MHKSLQTECISVMYFYYCVITKSISYTSTYHYFYLHLQATYTSASLDLHLHFHSFYTSLFPADTPVFIYNNYFKRTTKLFVLWLVRQLFKVGEVHHHNLLFLLLWMPCSIWALSDLQHIPMVCMLNRHVVVASSPKILLISVTCLSKRNYILQDGYCNNCYIQFTLYCYISSVTCILLHTIN